ncbi:MAG: NAD-dependent epimerase/dehydratase family protein [Armatimonadetes bacterium]|nr:NAD-dependent epimerase/dehydratase family protein [Armatimonadota bacterium]
MGNLLITGASGFFGRHLVRQAAERAHLAPSSSELNLLRFEGLAEWLAQNRIDTIIHAAGFVGGIGLNKDHPGRMAADNLRMGLNVLEAAARAGGMHVVIVSTICVYPEDASVPTNESQIYEGFPSEVTSFYGLAKRELLSLAEGLRREYGLSYTYIIPTNLYGPGDHFDEAKSHVVPALLRRALEAKEAGAEEIVVWGDGSQTRDLLYVQDAAKGVLLATDRGLNGEVFNLSSGRETSIKELAETICSTVGYEGRLVWDVDKPGGAPRRALDGTRASEIMGFQAETRLEDGLRKTLAWYLEHRES